MIKIENAEVVGWEHAIRGMRSPMNSWDKSDSHYCSEICSETLCNDCPYDDKPQICSEIGRNTYVIGKNDLELMEKLAKAGTDHRKFMRMITVYVDITAPMYWWKEFDTYKVGTVRNSCSTMHKITAKRFEREDFSTEKMYQGTLNKLEELIGELNELRELCTSDNFSFSQKKHMWYNIIQLLPSSYNQRSTVMLNYEVLANIYKSRHNHKLNEWVEFCEWIECLPYSEIIIDTLPKGTCL